PSRTSPAMPVPPLTKIVATAPTGSPNESGWWSTTSASRESGQGYRLMHDLELRRGEFILKIPGPVCRQGESVREQRQEPTGRDCLAKRRVGIRQMRR